MKISRRTIVVTTLVLVPIGLYALVTGYSDYEIKETRRAMLATAHQCPDGTTEKIERSGEIGWMRGCVKGEIRHGPFTYWKAQHKAAEGTYVDGKQVAVTYFDDTGKVIRVVEGK